MREIIEMPDVDVKSAGTISKKIKAGNWPDTKEEKFCADKILGGFIYVVTADEFSGIYKIGYAKDVKKRLAALQIGCPFKLRAIYVYRSIKYARAESKIHKSFSDKKVLGEWFSMGSIDLKRIEKIVFEVDNGLL